MEGKPSKIEKKLTLEAMTEKLKVEFEKFNKLVAKKLDIDNQLNNREEGLLSSHILEKSSLTKEEKIKLKAEKKRLVEETEKQRAVYLEVKYSFKKEFPENSDIVDEILYGVKK